MNLLFLKVIENESGFLALLDLLFRQPFFDQSRAPGNGVQKAVGLVGGEGLMSRAEGAWDWVQKRNKSVHEAYCYTRERTVPCTRRKDLGGGETGYSTCSLLASLSVTRTRERGLL